MAAIFLYALMILDTWEVICIAMFLLSLGGSLISLSAFGLLGRHSVLAPKIIFDLGPISLVLSMGVSA